jgi:signal peptidase I
VTTKTKRLLKKEHLQIVIAVALMVAIIFGFWFGSQIALNTKIPPALAVTSGSMCISDGASGDGWTHPFDRTLQVGDIIIIQGVNPKDLKTDYPNSDIIVFHNPENPNTLIVHRIAATTTIDGKIYFFTKGDGNIPPDTWPTVPTTYEYDPWVSVNASIPQGAVSQDLVAGKVIMRIPWVGQIAIFLHDSLGVNNGLVATPVIALLIVLVVLSEFAWPLLRHKLAAVEHNRARANV